MYFLQSTPLLLLGVSVLWSGSSTRIPTASAWWSTLPMTTCGRKGPLLSRRSRLSLYRLQDDKNDSSSSSSFNHTIIPPTTSTTTSSSLPSFFGQRNNFGDIMSPSSDDADVLFRDGLVTSETYSLAQMYGIHHPLDRMAVTANGNLQRLFSSYYDSPVTVVVDHCAPVVDTLANNRTWERRVQLQVFEQTFCVADSVVQVHSTHCCALVESGQVGLGQLFRYLNILPEFVLQAAGPTDQGGFWRNYTLTCAEVTCSITERFCPGVWELTPHCENELVR